MNTDPNPWLNANTSHVSPNGDTSLDMTRYNLTIEEVSQLFAEAGVPRAPRSITRFCALGDLECIRVDTEKNYKYLIDPKSVENRIEQLKQALHYTNKTSLDMSGHVQTINETSPDMSRHDEQGHETPTPNEEFEMLRGRVGELEIENIHLKISQKANEQVINQMNSDRKNFITELKTMSFQLGEATAKLQMLEAPRAAEPIQHTEPKPAEQVSDAVEVPSEPTPATPPPAPPVAEPEPERPGFLKRMFGR